MGAESPSLPLPCPAREGLGDKSDQVFGKKLGKEEGSQICWRGERKERRGEKTGQEKREKGKAERRKEKIRREEREKEKQERKEKRKGMKED